MRRGVVAAVVLGVVAALGIALLWVGQRRLLFFPSPVVADVPAGVDEVTLSTSDGLDLAAWLVPADDRADRSADSRRATVVVFHGNGGNRTGRLPLARALADHRHDVLLVDYRGYGGNPGSPSSAGLARDARAARDWVDERPDGTGAVVYLGESLGAGVAIELAGSHPPDALVLRSPFSSLADVAREHYPVVPGFFLRDRWPNVDRVAELDVPTLVVAGEADQIVPPEQSARVAEAAGGPGESLVVEGAGHNDRALLDGSTYVDAVDDFLTAHLAPEG